MVIPEFFSSYSLFLFRVFHSKVNNSQWCCSKWRLFSIISLTLSTYSFSQSTEQFNFEKPFPLRLFSLKFQTTKELSDLKRVTISLSLTDAKDEIGNRKKSNLVPINGYSFPGILEYIWVCISPQVPSVVLFNKFILSAVFITTGWPLCL